MPDYMRTRDIQNAFKEVTGKCTQNKEIGDMNTKNVEKLS
jgi:hypothetical protein